MISKRVFLLGIIASVVGAVPMVHAAVAARKQSAIQNGTTVRARVNATGVYVRCCIRCV